jgi:hypothetical protein
MKPSDIQKILEQQRKLSPIKDLDANQISKRIGALTTAAMRRKVPIDDYISLIREYWDINKQNDAETIKNMAERYDVKYGVIEKIVLNFKNTISDKEYAEIKKAYHKKYPNQRSASLKKSYANMTEEQKAEKNLNISIAQDPVDKDTALQIYYEYRYERTQKAYQQCADKYLDKNGNKIPWQKVRDIVNGHHYATEKFDIEADVKKYRLKVYGTFKFISPEGKVFHFEDEKACGEWMLSMDKSLKRDSDPYRVCKNKFDTIMPNTPTLMRRRFWIGWTLENIKHEN